MFNIEFDVSILEKILMVGSVFIVLGVIRVIQKEAKRKKSLKNVKDVHYNQGSLAQPTVKTSKDKDHFEEDPWASFDEKWDDLDKKAGK